VGHLVSRGVNEIGECVSSGSSDEIEISIKQSASEPGVASVGAQLLLARTKQNLSIEQIADQLKWSLRQIAAIEAGNYAIFHDSSSVRGFVRAYAKIVKLDAALLLGQLSIELAQIPTQFSVNALDKRLLDTPFPAARMPWLERRHRSYRILAGLFLLIGCLVVLLVFWAELVDFIRLL